VSAVDRNNPQRGSASEATYSLMEFMREFPDDASCLDFIWRSRHAPDGHTTYCPKCERERRFHRVKARPAYDCDSCGYHLHPLKGTIFEKSATSLHLWFYAMYLMSQTRCGVSAKHLERELGVTYKTAWRMANLIRNQLMDQEDEPPLSGKVEADETYVGGKRRGTKRGRPSADSHKTAVFGMVERKGRIVVLTVPNARAKTLMPHVEEHVIPGSMLYTDELASYHSLRKRGYGHDSVTHGEKVYVSGDVHTNTIEGFFGNLKRGISGNYHAVSRKWLQGYLNEFAFRYNHRASAGGPFKRLLLRAAT
jgi:transposase